MAKKEKSPACKKVLQLMDCDIEYMEALQIVLSEFPDVSVVELEKELDLYI